MSSYRRQQLEKDLPDPSPNLCEFLWKNFGEAGMNVPKEDVVFISKLVSAYVKQTPHGKATMLTLMNCKPTPASILNTYYRAGGMGREDQKIKPSELMEFKGWIHRQTNAVRWDAVEVDEREDASICDCCGGRFPLDYCLTNVEAMRKTGENRIEQWCNHCRTQHDEPRIRQSGDVKKCGACEKLMCEYNPRHDTLAENNKVALLPTRQVANGPPLPPGWVQP